MRPLALAAFAWVTVAAPLARADDTVRACISASTEGQGLRNRGSLIAAREEMITCARDACPAIVRTHCATWLSEIEAAIPRLVVRAEDAQGLDATTVTLTIDGKPSKLDGQAVRLDPGAHMVVIDDGKGLRREERVLLVQGESSRIVTLRLPAAPKPVTPATSSSGGGIPLGAWVLGGAGLALLGGATYFGIAAKSELDDLKGLCSPHCTSSQTQTGRTDALLFDGFLASGAAVLVGAVVWALAFPSRADTPTTALQFGIAPTAHGAVTGLRFTY